jgi:hypothetical protein
VPNRSIQLAPSADIGGLAMALSSPLWGWLAALAMVIAYLSAPSGQQFAGAVVGALSFALVESLLPACRPVVDKPLCPWNWALSLFFLQLIVLPVSVLVLGPSPGVLPELPSSSAINAAMFLNALAFVAFAATFQYCSSPSKAAGKTDGISLHDRESVSIVSRKFVYVYLVLGITGVFLAFGGVSSFLDYFQNPAEYVDRFLLASHTAGGLASLLLRPFLGFGLVALWCEWMDRSSPQTSPRRKALVTLLVMIGVVLSYGTYSYNRGAFFVPLVAMMAVLLAAKKRVSLVVLGVAAAVLAVLTLLAPFWAVYRNSSLTAAELLDSPAATDFFVGQIDPLETIQMYGSGPQYLGFLLEKSAWGRNPYLGSTLFPSLVEPLPVVGRFFRESSGPTIYNQMIYGTPYIFDQILPFCGEMFLNFHIFGVVLGFCLLAVVTHRLQLLFASATNSIDVYIWQYTAVWVLFLIIGSISVVTQTLFYFFWPVYLYFGWKRRAQRRPLPAHPFSNGLPSS